MQAHIEAIVKSLVAVAWADGNLAAQEEEVLEALIGAFQLEGDDAATLRAFGKEKKSLDDVPLTELSADDRRIVLQQAVIVTYADGQQCDDEKALLQELATRLRIPEQEAGEIIASGDRRAQRWLSKLS